MDYHPVQGGCNPSDGLDQVRVQARDRRVLVQLLPLPHRMDGGTVQVSVASRRVRALFLGCHERARVPFDLEFGNDDAAHGRCSVH